MYVGDADGPSSGPVAFIDGAPASGLTFTFGNLNSADDDLDFSDDNGATWTYAPTLIGDGFDPAVTHIRVRPQGAMAGGGSAPYFEIRYRVRVN